MYVAGVSLWPGVHTVRRPDHDASWPAFDPGPLAVWRLVLLGLLVMVEDRAEQLVGSPNRRVTLQQRLNRFRGPERVKRLLDGLENLSEFCRDFA